MIEHFMSTEHLRSDEIWLQLEHVALANPARNWVPAYIFAICDLAGNKMGTCDLRLGHNEQLYFGGNIGYRVEEPYRGHHYAAKACRLLFQLAKQHEMGYVIITCNPDNVPSRKTLEHLNGELLEIAELPPDNDMRKIGETHKCIFRFEL
jgi:tagatose 1,6-diphosphate aldolase